MRELVIIPMYHGLGMGWLTIESLCETEPVARWKRLLPGIIVSIEQFSYKYLCILIDNVIFH